MTFFIPHLGSRIVHRSSFIAQRSSLIAVFLCLAWTCQALAEPCGVVYDVRFEGVRDDAFMIRLESLSQTVALKDRPPATLALLERRTAGDVERFEALLASDGHFDGTAVTLIDTNRQPVRVVFEVERGPSYRLGEVEIDLPGSVEVPPFLHPGLSPDAAVTTRDVIAGEGRLVRQLRNHGYPFASAGEREVVVDHSERRVHITYRLDPGEAARFGDVRVEGRRKVHEKAIQRRAPWSAGDPFSAELMDKLRKELLGTGMFLTVKVEADESLDETGALPVTIRVRERKRRTLKLGLEFETDIGFGASLDWEYRNFLAREVRLNMSGRLSEIELAGEIQLTRDRFLRPDQTILLRVRIAEDSPDSYTSRNEETVLLVTRKISDKFRVTGGIALKVSKVEQVDTTENYTLLLSPWSADYNFSDDLLDPRKGGRAIAEFTPYTDIRSGDLTFARTFLEYRHYLSAKRLPGIVLAGRVAFGSIGGAKRNDVPADERFYAGGGGSIRGYAYQSVGQHVDGQPVGGNSLVETSLELRSQFGERWGVVGFIDGGMVYEDANPNDEPPLQWGAGLGLRIFTGLGPIRLDVAVPVNPRDNFDEDYQFYISLGQAF